MVRVNFPKRFIIDRWFFEKVMKLNPSLFMDLMFISSASKYYKKRHNLMSEKIRDDIIDKNPEYGPEYIKSALNKVNEPSEIEDIEDEIIRNIKYAVEYTNEEGKLTPICILTSDDMEKQ